MGFPLVSRAHKDKYGPLFAAILADETGRRPHRSAAENARTAGNPRRPKIDNGAIPDPKLKSLPGHTWSHPPFFTCPSCSPLDHPSR